MNIHALFEGEFGPEVFYQLQRAISWIPRELQPANDVEMIDKEALFLEFVQFKQKMISDALNSMYKVSHTSRTASSATVDECVVATTKGTAKLDNERWFLEQLYRSRLANSIVETRLQYLLDTYCVHNMALPVDLKPIKTACEASLRQKRIDFKQKIRKLYRKKIIDKAPDCLSAFQELVTSAIATSLGEEAPEDYIAAFSRLSPHTVRFFKEVLLASLPPEQTTDLAFLAVGNDEENGFEVANEEMDDAENAEDKGEPYAASTQSKKRNRDEVEGNFDEEADSSRKRPKGSR